MIGDYKLLQERVQEIIVHSQDYPFDIDCTELLNKWEEAKQPFIDLFGGKLFVRSKERISVTLSKDQRSRKFNEFLATLDNRGVLDEDLENFLSLNQDGFFDNTVILPYPSKHISPGSKMLRSFKHFIQSDETRKWAQNVASRYIQENKIEGYLYLSVDPRDFLTLAENNANWSSCHSLDNDYRAGNLSYMVDSTTMVAYLANEEPEHLKCLPQGEVWNSKKWRMLVHTNLETCIYYNRQYPYESERLTEATHHIIEDLLKGTTFMKPKRFGYRAIVYPNRAQTMLDYNQINADGTGRSYDMRDVIDTSEHKGYLDLITSSVYSPIVAVNFYQFAGHLDLISEFNCSYEEETRSFKKLFGLKIGASVPCPCCGKNSIERENSLLCEECIAFYDADEDFFLTCESCYHRIYDDEEIFFVNESPYCKHCYDTLLELTKRTEEEDNLG